MAGLKSEYNSEVKKFDDFPEGGEINEHMKAMWAGQSNVLVAVRVRPLMKHDVVKKSCVRTLDSKVVIIMDPAQGDKQDILRANRSREKQYAFDFVFEAGSPQESVYNNTTKFLIHGVLDGYNATVFAYGQTGSGKTYTMIGTQTEPGIMVRVMEDLFVHSHHQGRQHGVQYKVSVSFLEVYNENIRDLLSDVEEYLDLREDPIKGPVVASITEIEATSGQEIMQLLHQGNSKRSQAATAANEVSSRSHAVLQVVVECRDRAPGTVANIKVGKLSLVDLAGSERAANTKNVGQRLVEGANINRSLLALGNCINALGEKGNKGNFVPYRDSKLTRLLKDSLGGNCRTVMIANISSAESSFEETLNTLKYANRAKNIKTNVQRNVLNVNYHISEYVELINNLRSEIQVLKSQIGSGVVAERVSTSHLARESGLANAIISSPGPSAIPSTHLAGPSTPFQVLRESLRSGAAGEGRELVNNMRQRIVDNFQEKMQLRRSLIELEDQNVQNSIEVSKRQLLIVQWSEKHGNFLKKNGISSLTKSDFAAYILANGSPETVEAWQECEQLRKAIIKNNGMKKNIAKRLRHNEKEAEKFREDLVTNVTGEDRRELMALQYQVGRLELENMELEQHRIVHESILKGKDLIIQKLKLQLAVRDKLINRQQSVLKEHDLDSKVGYDQLALMEETLMGDMEFGSTMAPPSPPRNMADILTPDAHNNEGRKFIAESDKRAIPNSVVHDKPVVPQLRISGNSAKQISDDEVEDEYEMAFTEREVALTSRDRDLIEQGEWSEIQSELSDQSFSLGNRELNGNIKRREKELISLKQKEPQVDVKKSGLSKENKVVSGPRGGRMYRASVNNEELPSKKFEDKTNASKISKNPLQVNQDEFSDEEIVVSSSNPGIHGKYRHYASPRTKEQKGMTNVSSTEKVDSMPLIYPLTEENVASGRKVEKDSTPRSLFDNGMNRLARDKEKMKDVRPIAIFPRKEERNSNIGKPFEEDAADVLFSDNDFNELVIKSKPLGKISSKVQKNKVTEVNSKAGAELPTVSNNLDSISSLADLAINGDGMSNGRQLNRAKLGRPSKHPSKGAVIAPMENANEGFTVDSVDDGPLGVRIKSLPVLSKHPSGSLPNSARDVPNLR